MERKTLESKIHEASKFLPGIKLEDIIPPDITDLDGFSLGGVDSTHAIVCLDLEDYKVVAIKEHYMDWSRGPNHGIRYGTRLRIISQKKGESTLKREVTGDKAYGAVRGPDGRGGEIDKVMMTLVEDYTDLDISGGANSLWYSYVNRKTGRKTDNGGYSLDLPVYNYGTSYGYSISRI